MIKSATISEIGSRSINEDSVSTLSTAHKVLFALCDGLGGHGMGDIAATLVKDTFIQEFNNYDNLHAFLDSASQKAQQDLLSEQNRLHAKQKMKTTAVVLAVDKWKAHIGFVGDSRAYVFHRNKVMMRTLDHSVPQQLVLRKEITDSEIRNHPDRNRLLKVMGIPWDKPMFEILKPIPLWRCQAFLLCSDGFWELIDEKEMCRLLKVSKTPQEWLDLMVAVVKENGKNRDMDNFSAIAVMK